MKIKKVLLSSMLGFGIGFLPLFGYLYISDSNSNVNADSGEEQLAIVSSGLVEVNDKELYKNKLDEVDFQHKIKAPKSLPFNADKEFVEVLDIIPNGESDDKFFVREYYNSADNSSISISTTSATVIPSDEDMKKLITNKGQEVQYFTNEVNQFLYFNKDGLYYEINAKKDHDNPNKTFEIEELLSIVDSM